MIKNHGKIMERLYKKSVTLNNGCVVFTGCPGWTGHARMRVNGKLIFVHRLAWQLFNGPIFGPGATVNHKCDNPVCINLSHLWLGTQSSNTADRDEKNRTAKGEKIKRSILKEKDILEIRESAKSGIKTKELSDKYGVCTRNILQIVDGTLWKHVGGPIKPFVNNPDPKPAP